MRLGRYFDRYKVPQWAAHYIDYNAHKRTLKLVSGDVDATRAESILSGQSKFSLHHFLRVISHYIYHMHPGRDKISLISVIAIRL